LSEEGNMPDLHAHDSQRLSMLLEITKTIGSELNIDILLPLIAMQTTEALEADRASLYLVDDETNEVWTKVAMGITIGEIRQPVGVGLSGWVAESGQGLNIPDVYDDERFNQDWDKKTGYRTKSMLLWPMFRRDGTVQGVFQVINKMTDDAFDQMDVELLEALASSASIAVDNAEMYTANQRMMQSFFETLASTVDARDAQTGGHTERVTEFALLLGRKLELPADRLRVLRTAGLLHDYGKIAVPDAVLQKPGALDDDEYKEMQGHVSYSYEIVKQIEFPRDLRDVPQVAWEHHERNDGRGYPRGITGDEISMEGKILHVADVFDALACKRYYKPAMPMSKILSIIGGGRGTEFEEVVVDAFLDMLPEFKAILKKFDMLDDVMAGEEEDDVEAAVMAVREKAAASSGAGS
jgi:HD-GYP domain-containing protein (c-di-GMP phosphodiesterase class II)